MTDPPNLDYYSTAAHVIPLLFITLAIDLRGFFESPLDRKFQRWVRTREVVELRLVEAAVEVDIAQAKVDLGRELSPNERFEAFKRAQESVTNSFDGTEKSLKTVVQQARVGAALVSAFGMLALIVGEAVALRVLEAGEGSKTASGVIESVLWLGAALLIVGEAVALRVLEAGEGSKTASGVIESVLWLGAALLSWRLFDRVLDTISQDVAWTERRRFAILGMSTGLILAATYIAWHSF